MDQTSILLYIVIFLVCLAGLNAIKHTVGPKADDPLTIRAKLCQSYYEYLDSSHKQIEDLEKMCWRTDHPAPDAHI